MAAGLGFKTFNTGDVLTAADTNGYLMQGVLVFASATARDAAITSPQEGQFAYLKDTNTTMYYTGSAWTNLDTTGMVNPMTTTGDTIYASSGSTPARLPIGTTGQVLTVSGGVPAWATISSGGMTSIASGNLSGSTVNLSSIPSTYKNLQLVIRKFYASSTQEPLVVRPNAITSTYWGIENKNSAGTASQGAANTGALRTGSTYNAAQDNIFVIDIFDYANTTTRKLATFRYWHLDASNNDTGGTIAYKIESTSAISSIEITCNGNTFAAGTYTLYGVS